MTLKLNLQKPGDTGDYLRSFGLVSDQEQLSSLAPAGEGNMNLTLRAVIESPEGRRSLILKQANPFVQKYPTIAAPESRAGMEATFFRLGEKLQGVRDYLPQLFHFDAENNILVIEDLGQGGDCTVYYSGDNTIDNAKIEAMVNFLFALHNGSKNSSTIENTEMRALNHTHIFDLPFRSDNGHDLDGIQQGLSALARETIFDSPGLLAKAAALGQTYLEARGPSLLHGDFFPGSWMITDSGLRVIDPEFCFSGPAEFDLGVMMAHLRFCGLPSGEMETLFQSYGAYDQPLAQNFMAVEILRRFFGVAQLPLAYTIQQKHVLTTEALQILQI